MERTFDERFERPRILPPAVGGKRTMSMTVGADEKGEEYANEAEVRVEMQSGEFMHSTQTCTVKRASFEPTPAADTNECGEVYEDENKTWSRQQHQHQGHGRDGSASRFSNPSFHPPSTRIITALHPAVVGALEVANPTAGGCDVNLALVPNVSTTWTGGWEINAKQHLRELTDAMYNCNDDGGNGDGDGDDGEYEEGHGQGGRMMGELKASASMSTSTTTSTSSSSPSTHGSAGDMMMIQAFQSARVSKQKGMVPLLPRLCRDPKHVHCIVGCCTTDNPFLPYHVSLCCTLYCRLFV